MINLSWITPYAIIIAIVVSFGMAIIAWKIGNQNRAREINQISVADGSMIKAGDEIFIGDKKVIVLSRRGSILTVARIED